MLEIKNVLKMLKNSEIFYKIMAISGLTEREKVLLREFILREQRRDYVCEMLNISRSTFRDIKNQALLKVKISLINLLDEKINQLHK